jgi:hypothetical protein
VREKGERETERKSKSSVSPTHALSFALSHTPFFILSQPICGLSHLPPVLSKTQLPF